MSQFQSLEQTARRESGQTVRVKHWYSFCREYSSGKIEQLMQCKRPYAIHTAVSNLGHLLSKLTTQKNPTEQNHKGGVKPSRDYCGLVGVSLPRERIAFRRKGKKP